VESQDIKKKQCISVKVHNNNNKQLIKKNTMGNFITASPSEALAVSGLSGTRLAVGRTTFVFAFFESVQRISLELMSIDVVSQKAETSQGVPVSLSSVALVKVKARDMTQLIDSGPEQGNYKLDEKHIKLAIAGFGGNYDKSSYERDLEIMKDSLRQTLEGNQRQLVGTLTVEQLYRDREAFVHRVREEVVDDLQRMGFELVAYTIQSISDSNGYMVALGQTQVAAVKREAAEGVAKNKNAMKIKVTEFDAKAQMAVGEAQQRSRVEINKMKETEAESDQTLTLKLQEFSQIASTARVKAEQVSNVIRETLENEIVKQETGQRFIEKEILTHVAQQEASIQKISYKGNAEARFVSKEIDAVAIGLASNADAERIRIVGKADADGVRAKGTADAENMKSKAHAYDNYGDAALVQTVVEHLPEIAGAIARPLGNTAKITYVNVDGGGVNTSNSVVMENR
jgi:flotillin